MKKNQFEVSWRNTLGMIGVSSTASLLGRFGNRNQVDFRFLIGDNRLLQGRIIYNPQLIISYNLFSYQRPSLR